MHEFSAGSGKHCVKLQMLDSGDGWCGLLTGGERSHIGGVVMAVPRSRSDGQGLTCDLWITPAPFHKDTEAAAPLAKSLAQQLGVIVTISAGIHMDAATTEDILLIQQNCQEVGNAFLGQCHTVEIETKG